MAIYCSHYGPRRVCPLWRSHLFLFWVISAILCLSAGAPARWGDRWARAAAAESGPRSCLTVRHHAGRVSRSQQLLQVSEQSVWWVETVLVTSHVCGVLSTVYYLDILCNLTMEDGRSFTNGGITAISSFSSCVCKNKFISIQEVDRTLLIAFFFSQQHTKSILFQLTPYFSQSVGRD